MGSSVWPSVSRVMTWGLADLELEALAPHHLDEDGELQLAAARHPEGVGRVGLLDADATLLRRSFQSRSRSWVEVTKRPSRPAKGEMLDEKSMETVGSSMCMTSQGHGVLGIGDGLADLHLLDARHRDHIARPRLGELHAFEPLIAVEHGDLGEVSRRRRGGRWRRGRTDGPAR